MTAGLELLYKQVHDWDTWDVPGGRQWYSRLSDKSDDGFLTQLNKLIKELERLIAAKTTHCECCKRIFQLTRKMSDDAQTLRDLTNNPGATEMIKELEKVILEKHPEWRESYRLIDFITNQKCYLDQMTSTFRFLSEPGDDVLLMQNRLTFYRKLHNVFSGYLDVVNASHIIGCIDGKLRKTAFKEFMDSINFLTDNLAGWNNDASIDTVFNVPDTVKKSMQEVFGYDIETSALTDEVVSLTKHIARTIKDYQQIVKTIKHESKKPGFKFSTLVISRKKKQKGDK